MTDKEICKIIANIKLKTSFRGGDELWAQSLSVIEELKSENASLRERLDKAEKDNTKTGRALFNLAVKYVTAANIWTIKADDGKKYLAEKEICALFVIKEEMEQAEKGIAGVKER